MKGTRVRSGLRFATVRITLLVAGAVAAAAAPGGRDADRPPPLLDARQPSESSATSRFNHPGDILISDQYNNRVTVVDHGTPCNVLAVYGLPLDNGMNTGFGVTNANQGLNGPYDAKVIGDFTGMTPPQGFDGPEHGQGDPQ